MLGQVALREEIGADRVVDVVVDVGDAVDDAHDLPLERLRVVVARVLEDPVPHLPREVEAPPLPLEPLDDAQRVLVVAEAAAAALAQELVERLLPGVPERRMAEVVAEADRLDEILVQPQRPRDGARDAGRLERVREARAEVVALGVDEYLRLQPQPAERLRVDDAVAVALERRPQAALLLGQIAPAGVVRAHRERREPALLVLPNEALEGIGNPTGELRRHGASVVAGAACASDRGGPGTRV